MAARPRGGDWLQDEIADWQMAGVDLVLSLLTSDEEEDLGLRDEGRQVEAQGMKFVSLPIQDRQAPNSESVVSTTLERLDADLSSGKNVLVHCRQGVGRTGLIAACLLVTKGLSPESAIRGISSARGVTVPETPEQRRWIDHYVAVLASAK